MVLGRLGVGGKDNERILSPTIGKRGVYVSAARMWVTGLSPLRERGCSSTRHAPTSGRAAFFAINCPCMCVCVWAGVSGYSGGSCASRW